MHEPEQVERDQVFETCCLRLGARPVPEIDLLFLLDALDPRRAVRARRGTRRRAVRGWHPTAHRFERDLEILAQAVDRQNASHDGAESVVEQLDALELAHALQIPDVFPERALPRMRVAIVLPSLRTRGEERLGEATEREESESTTSVGARGTWQIRQAGRAATSRRPAISEAVNGWR